MSDIFARSGAPLAIEAEQADFALRAETHRRAGRVEEAERVAREGLARAPARSEARVVLGLTLLDQGRTEEARQELEAWVRDALPEPTPVVVTDGEIDAAFEVARSEHEQMLSADDVALRAIEEIDSEPLVGVGAEARAGEPGAVSTLERWLDNLRGGAA